MSDFKIVKLLDPIAISLTGPNFTGEYNNGTTYTVGQSVSYNGSSYVALAVTTGNLPTNTTYWQLLAEKGDPGVGGIVNCRNISGATITKGSVVYVSGASGSRATILKAQANSPTTSDKTFGVVVSDIANSANGDVQTAGELDNIDTSAFSAGDNLWLSPSVAGGLTNVEPISPLHSVFVGHCLVSNPSTGKILVSIQNGYHLEDLHDVLITTPTNKQGLTYDSGTGLWKNTALVNSFNSRTGDVSPQSGDYTKSDVGLGNVDNTSDLNKPISTATQTALDLKVDENAPITGATKTKITYDAKGLVTSGTDATTADIADSTNKRYVTDAQLVVIGNTSGTNTGDQTATTVPNAPAGNISATNVQAAINELDSEKQPTITGAATTITSSNLTASRALISDASGKVAVSSTVSDTELGYLDGVTSGIQGQINSLSSTVSNKVNRSGDSMTGNLDAPAFLTQPGDESYVWVGRSSSASGPVTTANDQGILLWSNDSQLGLKQTVTDGGNDLLLNIAPLTADRTQSFKDESGQIMTDNLPKNKIWIGDASDKAQQQDISGAASLDSSGLLSLNNNVVTNSVAAQMPANTIKGNNTGSTANQLDLTATQTTAMLNNVVGDSGAGGTKGLVPAPATADNVKQKFLRADGSWSGQADRYIPNAEAVTQINTFSQRSTTANQWFGMAYAPEINTYVAIAASGTNRFSISKDGLNWQDIAAPQNSIWSKVCWSSYLGIFCAVSYDGASQVATSPDGFVWTLRTASAACTWYDIAWSPELRLFAATSLTGGVAIMTSPDGITWTSRTTSDATTTNYYTVCWSPELSLFCAVRLNGSAFTSSNGITWTARTISNKSWSSVDWSPELGLFCAVGISGTNRCDTSPNGITWTSRAIQANSWRRVKWAKDHGMFIAVASGGQMSTSFDGITWTARTAPQATNQWYEILVPQGTAQIIICGITGTGRIMTATPSRAVSKQSVPRVINLAIYNSATAVTLGGVNSTQTTIFTAATAVTVTFPTDATAYFRNGVQMKFVQYGAGTVTFGGAGVTLRSRGGLLNTSGQYAVVYAEKIAANEWILSGDLA